MQYVGTAVDWVSQSAEHRGLAEGVGVLSKENEVSREEAAGREGSHGRETESMTMESKEVISQDAISVARMGVSVKEEVEKRIGAKGIESVVEEE